MSRLLKKAHKVTNYDISEIFKVMLHYHIKPLPGTMIIEANDCPHSVVMDIRGKIGSDPDFKHNIPSLATFPDEDDLKSNPPLEDLVTDWFIFS
jgi:hypothetical protein